jgi:hypothetical protein
MVLGSPTYKTAQKRFQEDWQLQNAFVFVVTGTITLGNEKVLDN